jgi:hypothetical protein
MQQLVSFFIPVVVVLSACGVQAQTFECPDNAELAIEAMDRVTDVVVHDIFTPPVSSRIYAYTSLAAYSAYEWAGGKTPFTVALNDFPATDALIMESGHCPSLVMLGALFTTAKAVLFSEDKLNQHLNEMLGLYFSALDSAEMAQSLAYGAAIGKHINKWALEDGYRTTRGLDRYTLLDEADSWEPTPPDHMDPVEPYWNKIRPFVLQAADQCRPPGPTPFDTVPGSRFYEEAMEVYRTKQTLTDDQKATVWFWDDNPFVTVHEGHLVYAKKKVSPAGHWMGITSTAIRQSNVGLERALFSYAMVSVGLADAFISCWDEKYRSNLIRPVTYINAYIDPLWEPYLQTPPFPEYTSGHSVISASASTILTALFGDNIAYTDSVETLYGLQPRTYNSFLHAADEAAFSRLYGGIHYRPGIEVGVNQGRKVAQLIIAKFL